jgi:hypothetical protein
LNFLFKLKLGGFEKKLEAAQRVSYYSEEAAGMRLLGRLKRAYEEGDYRGAVGLGYELVTRYHDLNTAYYFLARSLARLGENELALKHYWNGVLAERKSMDSVDDEPVDEMLRLAANVGSLDRLRKWFDEAGQRDPKIKRYLDRLQKLGKL